MKAILNGVVVAESNHTIKLEGNDYFPPDSIVKDYFVESNSISHCPWKGQASYYNANVNGKKYKDVGWFYPDPFSAAAGIQGHVAFYVGKKQASIEP